MAPTGDGVQMVCEMYALFVGRDARRYRGAAFRSGQTLNQHESDDGVEFVGRGSIGKGVQR